ncbi:MAG: hypothetical protein ACI8S6_003003 [Myxococcota bacterium]|jgi:hypothetical protein
MKGSPEPPPQYDLLMEGAMTILSWVLLAGCVDKTTPDTDTDTGTDTGTTDTLSFEARIQVECANTECTDVTLYGDASGSDVVSYLWTTRGEESGTTDTITVTAAEPGELVDNTLTVTDSTGATSTASVALARMDFSLGAEGTTGFDPSQATIAMPGGQSCGSAIAIASIGGCLRNNDYLHYVAKDLGTGGGFRGDPIVYDAQAGGFLYLTKNSFIDAAAWFQGLIHGGSVQFHNMQSTDYDLLGGRYHPIARDPVVLAALNNSTALPEDHFTIWLTPLSTGTEVFASHINLVDGSPVFHERKITMTCEEGGEWVFGLEPVTEDDELNFDPVVTPEG